MGAWPRRAFLDQVRREAMSDYTAVQFGAMSTGEADFASVYAQLQSTLDTLQSQLQSSLQSWTGSARQAYYAAKAEWDAAAADMATVVQQLSAVVGTANHNYQAAESTNTAMW
jgi:WXG100 family type VII secretion target